MMATLTTFSGGGDYYGGKVAASWQCDRCRCRCTQTHKRRHEYDPPVTSLDECDCSCHDGARMIRGLPTYGPGAPRPSD